MSWSMTTPRSRLAYGCLSTARIRPSAGLVLIDLLYYHNNKYFISSEKKALACVSWPSIMDV
jgi:hypothetical protein